MHIIWIVIVKSYTLDCSIKTSSVSLLLVLVYCMMYEGACYVAFACTILLCDMFMLYDCLCILILYETYATYACNPLHNFHN